MKSAKHLNVLLEKKWTILSLAQGKNSAQYTRQSHWAMQRNKTIDKVLFLYGAEYVRILWKRKKTVLNQLECINMHMHKGAELRFHCQC